MPQQFEVASAEQMGDVRLLAREEVVETDHIVAHRYESVTEMAAKKAGAAGDENAFERGHGVFFTEFWMRLRVSG
jgi:hypothetical protein